MKYFSENRWLVAYYFDDVNSTYDEDTKATIRATFDKWGQETCVKMVEKSKTDSEFEYKMNIKQDSSRINSYYLVEIYFYCTSLMLRDREKFSFLIPFVSSSM